MQPPELTELASEIYSGGPQRMVEILEHAKPVDAKGRYLHWDQMRHRQPPEGITLREWWAGTAMSRAVHARTLPFAGTNGRPFRFTNIDRIQEMVHRIDQQASGRIQAEETVASVGSSDIYVVSSLIEEAITSSLLEGAATTRAAAKDLLVSGRRPASHGERMVMNNYAAMLHAEELAASAEPLQPQHVLELHRIVTDGTLDDDAESGRLQQPREQRVAIAWNDGRVMHKPPPAHELPNRLDLLCAFANGRTGEGFLHPVVRAVLIHFCLGHDHPFADGNGRTARALFYWSMLRSGYWLAQYLSISAILRKAPAQYAYAYLHAETDSNDATYFVIHQLEAIERAIAQLRSYLARKSGEISEAERQLRGVPELNHRQIAIVSDSLRNPDRLYTFAGMQRLHRVAYQSARTDLLGLEALGLLQRTRRGRKFEFSPQADLADRIHRITT